MNRSDVQEAIGKIDYTVFSDEEASEPEPEIPSAGMEAGSP